MISLIIPSHNESGLLWATVASARSDLESLGEPFEIIAVINETDSDPHSFPAIAAAMLQTDFCKVIFSNKCSPPGARNLGFSKATGEFIFFCDAHCIFPAGFFRALLDDARATGADAIFGGTRFIADPTYGCTVGWQDILWGMNVHTPVDRALFQIVSVGHGAFGISREAFTACGQYWPALRSWGGEETQLNLKLWMMGRKIYLTPRVFHWHYTPPGIRRGFEIYSDRDFIRNFLMVAAAYGGEAWARRVRDAFRVHYWQGEEKHPDLLDEVLASEEVRAERTFIDANAKYKNLEELRAMFNEQGVIN